MMVTYRFHMQIVADLLTATYESGQDGIKTTQLLKKTGKATQTIKNDISTLGTFSFSSLVNFARTEVLFCLA